MALTLVEAGKLHATNGDFKKAGITMAFAAGSPLVAAMPAINISGNAYSWTEEGVLPSVAARKVGSTYTASEGKLTPRTEVLKVYGGTINIDRVIIKTMGEEQRSAHAALKAKALGQALGYDLIEGSTTTSGAQVIDGLLNRYPSTHSQSLDSAGTACSMVELDQVIQSTSGATHLVMTRQMARLINVYLRSSGTAVRIEKDAFGAPLMFYADLPILIADPVGIASAYQPLQGGGGDDAAGETSILCLSLSSDGVHLIQNGGLEIVPLGATDEGTSENTLVEWIVGLADESPYSVGRYAGIAESTAVTA